jgi:hypothetical protein
VVATPASALTVATSWRVPPAARVAGLGATLTEWTDGVGGGAGGGSTTSSPHAATPPTTSPTPARNG